MSLENSSKVDSDIIKGPVRITPFGPFTNMRTSDIERMRDVSSNGAHKMLRDCSLAVLNAGAITDDATELFDKYSDFEIEVDPNSYGVDLILRNAPASAFTQGENLIRGSRAHLYSVLRDITYFHTSDENDPENVYNMLFNAGLLQGSVDTLRDRVVCWGGHSINDREYEYSKQVGYQLGLLDGVDLITGCGPGVMKGPMKGAHIGHGKQQIYDPTYIGLTEPGIIAAEPPNAMVNNLVTFPNIEQRLEAFVRLGHGITVFPGGAGTAEELQYILGVLMHPENTKDDPYLPVPVILTGPADEGDAKGQNQYVEEVNAFIRDTLGDDATRRYEKVVGDPRKVAERMKVLLRRTKQDRLDNNRDLRFNRELYIPEAFKAPFDPTHANVANLKLDADLHDHKSSFAADLRRAFSAIVSGNVKRDIIREVREKGNFQITGSSEIAKRLDHILTAFKDQGRMKIEGAYTPCYDIKSE